MTELYKIYPLVVVGGLVGVISVIFIVAYCTMKDKRTAIGFDRSMSDKEVIRRLLGYAKPHIRSFILVGILLLFSVSYDVVSPLLVGRVEEILTAGAAPGGDFAASGIPTLVTVYASILIVSLASTYLQTIILQRVGQKILSKIREDTFSHIESLSHAQLNQTPVGKLVTRVTNDANAISMMFTGMLTELVKNAFVIVGVLGAMLCLNYMLTMMVLCFVPFILLFTVIFRKFSRRAYRKVKDETTELNTFLSENLSGIKITQIFCRENKKMEQFDRRNDALGHAKRRQIFTFSIFRPLIYMLYITSVLCLFYLGSRGYIDGWSFLGQTVSSGVVVSFYMYINKFFNPIQSLADQFNRLQSALASAEKIFVILDTPPDIVDSDDAIELDSMRGDIEFRDVWFAYDGEEWVLRGVSFKVSAGQTVAFVGATGSGKTTILSLLCRNYDVVRGSILVDGVDVRHIKIASLRRHFGQMLQDVFLFSGTVRSNITLGNEHFTDEQVRAACRYVNADSFVDRLPLGLEEPIRERGNNLSVGQRQLISFARTVLHEPAVMILDEATANIDTETELLIQDSLEKMMSIGTMLVVAHRLSTIRHADNIIFLDSGVIAEQGNHEQLIARGGRYYELYTIGEERERRSRERKRLSDGAEQ